MQTTSSCPWCGHLVTLAEENGKIFIPGHHFFREEEDVREVRSRQIGGPDLVHQERSTRQVRRHCNGGSLRIVALTKEDEVEKPYVLTAREEEYIKMLRGVRSVTFRKNDDGEWTLVITDKDT